jgi:hypothetical protein
MRKAVHTIAIIALFAGLTACQGQQEMPKSEVEPYKADTEAVVVYIGKLEWATRGRVSRAYEAEGYRYFNNEKFLVKPGYNFYVDWVQKGGDITYELATGTVTNLSTGLSWDLRWEMNDSQNGKPKIPYDENYLVLDLNYFGRDRVYIEERYRQETYTHTDSTGRYLVNPYYWHIDGLLQHRVYGHKYTVVWNQGVGTIGQLSLKGKWEKTSQINTEIIEMGTGTVRFYQKDASHRYFNAIIESKTMSTMVLKVTSVNGYAGFIAGDTINVIYYLDETNTLHFGWEPHYQPQFYETYTLVE